MKFLSLIKKTFKNITVFDRVFIGLALVAVLGFYLFFKRDVVDITVKFKIASENIFFPADPLRNEFAVGYMVGDAENDELGRKTAEIVSVESYKTSLPNQIVYLNIRLKAVYNPRTQQYSLKGKNIIFGEFFDFSFQKAHIRGLVVDFPGFQDSDVIDEGTTIVKTQIRDTSRSFSETYGIPDYLASAISVGDSVRDSNGKDLAKILDIQVRPAKRLVVSASGQPFIVDDPYLKDVFATMELATKKIQGKIYMYDYKQVVIGAIIPFNTDTISVAPTIIDIIR